MTNTNPPIENPVALLYGQIAASRQPILAPLLPGDWSILTWQTGRDDPDSFAGLLAQADVMVGGPIPVAQWPAASRLRLCQVPWAGYDWARPDNTPVGVPFCNTYEHEGPLSEFIMLSILESQIGLRRMDRDFRDHGWNGKGPGNSVVHGEVAGKTIGIVGYGHIGEAVAKRAVAFGMRCIGVRRSSQACPPHLDWLGSPDRLNELLEQSDYVLIACDLNEQTRGMVDQSFLARMKSTAWLINVARGAVVDEESLYEALVAETIGGAIIDTWYNYPDGSGDEPWPSNKPFHELSNTILSAHESAWTAELQARRWQFVADNLERVRQGKTPLNQVHIGTAETGAAS